MIYSSANQLQEEDGQREQVQTFFKNNTLEAQKTADAMAIFTDFTGLEINAEKSTATMNRHGRRQETAEGRTVPAITITEWEWCEWRQTIGWRRTQRSMRNAPAAEANARDAPGGSQWRERNKDHIGELRTTTMECATRKTNG